MGYTFAMELATQACTVFFFLSVFLLKFRYSERDELFVEWQKKKKRLR